MSIIKTTENGSMQLPINENPEKIEQKITEILTKLRGPELFKALNSIKNSRNASSAKLELFTDAYNEQLDAETDKTEKLDESEPGKTRNIEKNEKNSKSELKKSKKTEKSEKSDEKTEFWDDKNKQKTTHDKLVKNAANPVDESVRESGMQALESVKSEIHAIRNAIEIVSSVINLNNQVNLYRRKLKRKNTEETAESEISTENRVISGLSSSSKPEISQLLPQSPKKQKMRRGVLMNLLNKSAKQLPLWIGVDNEAPPNLCGSIVSSTEYMVVL